MDKPKRHTADANLQRCLRGRDTAASSQNPEAAQGDATTCRKQTAKLASVEITSVNLQMPNS